MHQESRTKTSKAAKEKFVLRPCTEQDYPELLSFLDVCFRKSTPHWFASYMGHIFRPYPHSIQQNLICRKDGHIAGSLGIYPHTMRIGAAALSLGGIGSVAVHPESRNEGIMSAMLQQAKIRMRRANYDLSWLQGDRLRYRNYGWELGGRTAAFTIRRLNIDRAVPHSAALKVIEQPESHTGEILNLYNRFETRIDRTEEVLHRHLSRHQFGWLIGKTAAGHAYLIYEKRFGGNIFEIQGDTATVASLLMRHCEEMDIQEFRIVYPCIDDAVFRFLFSIASDYTISHSQQIQIINPDSLWDKIVPELASRFFAGKASALKVLGRITTEDRLAILNRAFGFFDSCIPLPKHLSALNGIRPLPWWIPKLDAV